MRLLRVGTPGLERPVVRGPDGQYYDLGPLTQDVDQEFLDGRGVERARVALDAGRLPLIDLDGARIGPPVARPGALYCIGYNYPAHAAESGQRLPTEPVVFTKGVESVVGPYDDALLPFGATQLDWEAELAVVMGATARRLASPAKSLDYVAGFVVSNDLTERSFGEEHLDGSWPAIRTAPTLNPLGPWLVPVDTVPDPGRVSLRSWVNGQLRQNGTTSEMLFDVSVVVWYLSQHTSLEPGDVINTGTPHGTARSGRWPFLRVDDVVEVEAEGLGRQRQHLRPGTPPPSPPIND